MPNQFLALDPARRLSAFEQVATQRGLHPGLIEKDFWVTWLLSVLFSHSDLAQHLVFKGGTSLSKVFGVIERFSEDIDISVAPKYVGFDPTTLDGVASRTKREGAMQKMQALCKQKAETEIAPALEAAAVGLLGKCKDLPSWISFEVDGQSQSPTLLFHYPTHTTGLEYVRRSVKVELGSLTDQEPTRLADVRPWIADAYPQLFTDWECKVRTLELGRTFWEKATILHSEFHRPMDQPTPDRYARHYSDVAKLVALPESQSLLSDKEQCVRVGEWKMFFFPRAWSRYDLARHGTFRLVPASERKAALGRDYATMEPMFLKAQPSFSEVLGRLAAAEAVINAMG